MSMSDIKINKIVLPLERETQLPFEQLPCSSKEVKCDDEVNKEHKTNALQC